MEVQMEKNLELYIHIPFCIKKCSYCDFLSFPANDDIQESYVRQLRNEIGYRSSVALDREISSIYIGGGTPSILREKLIADILRSVRVYFRVREDAEITIECNPSSVMRHKFALYREVGINRVSLGLQSANNAELKMLGRVHSFEEFLRSYQSARMEKIENINVDLIDAIPMQSMKSWRNTLRNVCMLKPEHISVYDLIIEEGTPFYEMQKRGLLRLPTEEEQEELDKFKQECLSQYGYERYEISNYARPGFLCRHNQGYWTGEEYLGLGLGASSYFAGERWENIRDIKEYLGMDFIYLTKETDALLRTNLRKLSREEMMEEFIFLGMRMIRGVKAADFKERFGTGIEEVYGEVLDKNEKDGLIHHDEEKDSYYLTERGLDVSNVVLSEFLLSHSPAGLSPKEN